MDSKEGTSATRAKNKYNAKAYDRIHISVKKGHKKEIEEAAASHSLSLNAFLNLAIENIMESTNPNGCPNNLDDTMKMYIDSQGAGHHILQCSICKKFYYQDFSEFRLYELQKDIEGTWFKTQGFVVFGLSKK